MILLDTNIISEMMKNKPSAKVMAWIDGQEITQLFIATIIVAEISYGINALPNGNRREFLIKAFDSALNDAFKHRILPFDELAAHKYGKIMSHRKKIGRPFAVIDGQIAAIALSQGAALATRNTRDFSDCDLELIDPFVE